MAVELNVEMFPLFIDGQWMPASTGETYDVYNPATGAVVAKVAKGGREDVERAVRAARAVFDAGIWSERSPQERGELLIDIGKRISKHAQELVRLEVMSSGGTIRRVSFSDVVMVSEVFQTMGKMLAAYSLDEELPDLTFPGVGKGKVWREPVGVCAAITPWNMPMMLAAWKIAPALAMGNTIVIKPASYTPLSTLKLAEIISQVVPPGVVNVVTGSGAEVGEALVTHPEVDKVAFTGSTEVGRRIMQLASGTIKRTTLELGGKSPNILLEDADLEIALPGSLFGVFLHSGQLCESGTRLFVPANLYDKVIEGLVELTSKLKLGNPADMATDVGPVISRQQKETVLAYIESGLNEGAKIVCGGREAHVPGCEKGHFIEPTIFVDVRNDMKIAQEEIFGPVLSVIRYEDLDEAIRMANDTIYGLAAGIWTRDEEKALAIARKIRAGTVWINDWHRLRSDGPFGGYKQSGLGRELGKYALDEYSEIKHVHITNEPQLAKRIWYRALFSNM
ncbi:MAG: aldehyde dehydrogenase family protein [Bacillota bacterium]|nr:aldehyde dehydrogenase [Bacillota bacterium]